MAQADDETTENNTAKEPETPLDAIDELNMALHSARSIISTMADGAEAGALFDISEVAGALNIACDLIDQTHAAAQRLHEFTKRERV
jgi:hypothetical protein